MYSKRTVLSGTALSIALALTATASAQEQQVKAKDVPAPVLAAATKAFPKTKLKGWEKEIKDGKTFYEVALVEGTAKRQAVFAADGPLLEIEEVIAVGGVPPAVRYAVKTKYPNAAIHAAEKITRGSEVEYEVGLKNAPKKEMVLAADGKILKEQ